MDEIATPLPLLSIGPLVLLVYNTVDKTKKGVKRRCWWEKKIPTDQSGWIKEHHHFEMSSTRLHRHWTMFDILLVSIQKSLVRTRVCSVCYCRCQWLLRSVLASLLAWAQLKQNGTKCGDFDQLCPSFSSDFSFLQKGCTAASGLFILLKKKRRK